LKKKEAREKVSFDCAKKKKTKKGGILRGEIQTFLLRRLHPRKAVGTPGGATDLWERGGWPVHSCKRQLSKQRGGQAFCLVACTKKKRLGNRKKPLEKDSRKEKRKFLDLQDQEGCRVLKKKVFQKRYLNRHPLNKGRGQSKKKERKQKGECSFHGKRKNLGGQKGSTILIETTGRPVF